MLVNVQIVILFFCCLGEEYLGKHLEINTQYFQLKMYFQFMLFCYVNVFSEIIIVIFNFGFCLFLLPVYFALPPVHLKVFSLSLSDVFVCYFSQVIYQV